MTDSPKRLNVYLQQEDVERINQIKREQGIRSNAQAVLWAVAYAARQALRPTEPVDHGRR